MKAQRRLLLDIAGVLFGNALYAFGVVYFIVPGHLITGGTTGLALFANRMAGVSVSLFLLVVNGLLFMAGLFVLGKKFAATTVLSTFFYPIAVEIMTRIKGEYVLTEDSILCTIFGGLCIGVAIGVVMRVGASTGGMDIPPLILHRFFRLPVSGTIYILDMIILLLQAVESTGEEILRGLLLVIIYSVVLDKCLIYGKNKLQVKVISDRAEEIKKAVLEDVDRGVTLVRSVKGYSGKDTDMVLTVISNRELAKVERLVHAIDDNAFVMVNQVNEVSGRGFTKAKQYGEGENTTAE